MIGRRIKENMNDFPNFKLTICPTYNWTNLPNTKFNKLPKRIFKLSCQTSVRNSELPSTQSMLSRVLTSKANSTDDQYCQRVYFKSKPHWPLTSCALSDTVDHRNSLQSSPRSPQSIINHISVLEKGIHN